MDPTRAASLYQTGVEIDLADAGGAQEEHGSSVGDGAQGLGDRSRCADSFHHVGEAAHQHGVVAHADLAHAHYLRERLEMAIVRIRQDHMISPARRGGVALMGVACQHRDWAVGIEALERRDSGESDDAGANHQDRVAVVRCRPEQAVRGDRDRLVQARAASVTASGNGCSIDTCAST